MAFTPQNNKKIATTSPTTTDDVSKNYTPGSQWFNQSTGEFFVCQNSTIGAAVWSTISGGGGGVGSSSTWTLLNADSDLVSSWTNTGTGVFTLDGAAPISGVLSYKFVAAAQNDEIKRVVTPIFRNKGKENSVSLQYTMNVLGFEAQIYDTATATIIEQIPLAVSTSSQTLNIPFVLKDTSTTVELRMINTHLTNTPILVFDDVEFSDDPFVYKNLLNRHTVVYTGFLSGVGAPMKLAVEQENNVSGSGLITISNIAETRYTFNVDASFTSSFNISVGASSLAIIQLFDSLGVRKLFADNGNFTRPNVSLDGFARKGDYLIVQSSVSATNDETTNFSVTANAESQHVITPVKDQVTRVVAAGNNGGVITANVTDINFTEIIDEANAWNGTQYVVPYDSDVTITGSILSTATSDHVYLYKNGLEYKIIGRVSSLTGAVQFTIAEKFLKNDILSLREGATKTLSNNITFHHIEITARAINAVVLGAIPKRRVAYIKDVKAINVTGPSIVGVQTRVLNTIEGDGSIVTLNLNQFTPIKGRYSVDSSSPAYIGGRHYIYLYNATTNTTEIIGRSAYTSATDDQTYAALKGTIIANGSDSYEIRHYITIATGIDGLGVANLIDSSIYTTVTLEKLD